MKRHGIEWDQPIDDTPNGLTNLVEISSKSHRKQRPTKRTTLRRTMIARFKAVDQETNESGRYSRLFACKQRLLSFLYARTYSTVMEIGTR